MTKQFTCCFLFLVLVAFASCHFMENTGAEPSYIRINPFTVHANPALQGKEGSLSSKITDAWIYVDEEYIGTFELPTTIPVLKAGKHSILISPGILNGGVSNSREIYPFYTAYTDDNFIFSQNKVAVINPVTKYYGDISEFKYIEDFENGSQLSPGTDTNTARITIDSIPSEVFEGKASGKVVLNSRYDTLEARTIQSYAIQNDLPTVFLELNYNTTNDFVIGLVINRTSTIYADQRSAATLYNTHGVWKKVYIEVSSIVQQYTDIKNVQVFVAALKDPAQNQTVLYFDNIKLICSP